MNPQNDLTNQPAQETGQPYLPFFKTTEWTVILTAGTDDPSSSTALTLLCQNYYPALSTYLCHCGYKRRETEELLQEFFHYFLDKKIYQDACPERGRFRCFILRVMKYFLLHERNRQHTQKRGGGLEMVLLDDVLKTEATVPKECIDPLSPDVAFDRKWALATVQIAMEQLRKECEASGRLELFQALKARLVVGNDKTLPYAELSPRLGKSEAALRVDACRLRQRFHQLLYQTVKRTLLPEISVEEEMEHLLSILKGK